MRAVGSRDAYSNLVLPSLLRERRVTGRDAAFATELAYGTLRGLGLYDEILAACIDRPLDGVDPPVLDLLRLGAHQLLAMRVPPHAAVSETVNLARRTGGEGPARFVNAVLRRVGRQDVEQWIEQVAPAREEDPVGHLAVAYSHPPWVVAGLLDALGGSFEETERCLAADNAPPEVVLAARPGRSSVEELVGKGARPGRWSPYAAILGAGDPRSLSAIRTGRAGVQDEGSQLVALALAEASLSGPDARWLDLCAGPGGKAALLAALAGRRRPSPASVLAAEIAPHRARLVHAAIGPGARVVIADGRRPPWPPYTFDRVLVDAPCTGLGSLRRRPEVRWRRQPEDVARLTRLQLELLDAAVTSARAGGLILYATCSPLRQETSDVVSRLVTRREDVQAVDVRPFLPGVPDLGPGPHAQLWPHRHGTDAMFLALLRRHDGPGHGFPGGADLAADR